MKECCVEHEFEPRYNETEEIDHLALDKGIEFWKEDETAFEVDYKTRSKIYLFDICRRCGLKINKEK